MADLKNLNDLVSLCKRRGFVFQSSEIYGGLNSCWDYGPLGVELLRNVKNLWWNEMMSTGLVEGVDCSILMHPKVWEASGHVANFTDPLIECMKCHQRFREDQLKEKKCTNCKSTEFSAPRMFNLMFKTFMGPVEDAANIIYMRPETAQGQYVNFQNVQVTSRRKLPFGIAQIGKAFRNEITPGNFIFRTREFEQMEMQFFVTPGEDEKWMNDWKEKRIQYYLDLGVRKNKIRFHPHGPNELAHYAKAAVDIEYEFPIGFQEIEGIHNRTDFDLKNHQTFSGKNLQYFDEAKKEKYVPYIIECSAGANRNFLTFVCDAYQEEAVEDDTRIVLKLHPKLSPIKVAFLPLMKKDGLLEFAEKLYDDFRKTYRCDLDDSGTIGKRYRRQDEIGTPLCVTIDYQSKEDQTVTIRDRDTMKQDRVPVDQLKNILRDRLEG